MSGFPRRSETFAVNELRALDAAGMLGYLAATKPGDPGPPQPGCAGLLDRVELLQGTTSADQAACLAERLRCQNVVGIHAYFAHTPTDVAMAAAEQLGMRFGFSIHARDARKVTQRQLRQRAASAACVVPCNAEVALELRAAGIESQVIPHGVDTSLFLPSPPPADEKLRLLAIGRLVEKKGFRTLIAAVAQLEISFHLRIVGDGPERAPLQAAIDAHQLGDRVTLCGPLTHAQLPAEYANAHVVVVPSIVDRDGDRDGLPNVVLEAMASARAVVASDVAAIPSAVRNGDSGLLVPPADAAALARALSTLAGRPDLRESLGARAAGVARTEFELDHCAGRFVETLRAAYA